ncbi:hypothetical protein EJ08DRAFT_663588 [Tothia fuscella]|uniref:Uncharacterized protein n=1 Tax=Tothia fuscella TaxID=1048955 RepID=A0A9P4NKX5_9PEZI|nr:hypothetical protein EJ08DRAFT_663588 [Tothia fuscella]
MTETNGSSNVAAKLIGSVLEHEFGPTPQSYFATPYPHPIAESAEAFLRSRKYAPAWKRSNGQDDRSQLSFLYRWIPTGRPGPDCEWNWTPTEVELSGETACHPALALRLGDFPKKFNPKTSYVAFGPSSGPTPDCFFIRQTDANGGDTKNGRNEWVGGRLRAVEFGYDGSWVVYSGKNNYDFWLSSPHDKSGLVEAFETAKHNGWSINKVSLNLRNPNEYVLAFNEDPNVFAAVHRGFVRDLRTVVTEWASGRGMTPSPSFPNFRKLTDDECTFPTRPPTPPPSIAGARESTSTDAGGILGDNYGDHAEDEIGDIRPSPLRLRHSRGNSNPPIQLTQARRQSSTSDVRDYDAPRVFIRPAPRQRITSPLLERTELPGNVPPHYHHHPDEEIDCVLCLSGYEPRRPPRALTEQMTEASASGEAVNTKKKGKKKFRIGFTRDES